MLPRHHTRFPQWPVCRGGWPANQLMCLGPVALSQMVATAAAQLRDEGFVELKEGERWAEEGMLQKGGRYYYSR